MRKFRIGDSVKANDFNSEAHFYDFKGETGRVIYVEPKDYEGELVYEVEFSVNEGKTTVWMKEEWLSLVSVPTNVTDDEIYEMLKPKMEKMGIDSSGMMTAVTMNNYGTQSIDHYMPIEDVKRLVATVYRSGYGRGQKGRSFIIGEKKEKGHWAICEEGEKLTPGIKLRRNYIDYKDGDIAIGHIPVGTEVVALNGEEDNYVHICTQSNWVSFPNGNNGKNKEPYRKFHSLTGYHTICIGEHTEYFDKWVEE